MCYKAYFRCKHYYSNGHLDSCFLITLKLLWYTLYLVVATDALITKDAIITPKASFGNIDCTLRGDTRMCHLTIAFL